MPETEKNRVEGGTLYLVATPIGNLADMTERGVKVLTECDFIAAEDTRNTAGLLAYFGIRKELVSYHEHNKKSRGGEIAARLEGGESCALVTDAGMPAISDPGEDLVRLCGEHKKRLEEIRAERRTLIFYEAPHKLRATLADLLATFGDRKLSLCRELTKRNEETVRTTTAGAVAYYETHEPRGEYVLVLAGAEETTGETYRPPVDEDLLSLSPAAHVARYESAGLARMDAIKAAARDRGMTKSELYRILAADKA